MTRSKILQLSNVIALVVTVIVNYLSNTGIFNGNTMATVSARYENLFTPAGYAFSVWGLIYLFLAAFVIHQSKGIFGSTEAPPVVSRIGWAFVFSCIMNSLWVLAWLYDYTGLSVVIMALLLLSLLHIVRATRMELDVIHFKTIALEWWPFSIYLGWICVAMIANVAALLTKYQWDGFGISPTVWTVIMIFIAGAVNLLLIWKRNMREAAMIGVWGLVAVAVANQSQDRTVFVTALIVAGILFISSGIHGFMNRGRHFIEEKSFIPNR